MLVFEQGRHEFIDAIFAACDVFVYGEAGGLYVRGQAICWSGGGCGWDWRFSRRVPDKSEIIVDWFAGCLYDYKSGLKNPWQYIKKYRFNRRFLCMECISRKQQSGASKDGGGGRA